MWRTRVSSHLQTLARSTLHLCRSNGGYFLPIRTIASAPSPFQKTAPLFTDFDNVITNGKKRVEDVMPIATGHEREELEAELEGRKRFDMVAPVGPFGTKEAPAIVKSYYDKRIVGCPGGEGEDEHDVVWFWLEKGHMNALCVLNISCWKWLVRGDRLMDMVMMITDAGDANFSFQNKYW